jgi:hypothetical protein
MPRHRDPMPRHPMKDPPNAPAVRAANSACRAQQATSLRMAMHRRVNAEATQARATAARHTRAATIVEDSHHPTVARTAGRRRPPRHPMTAAPNAPRLHTAEDPIVARRPLTAEVPTDAVRRRTVADHLRAAHGLMAVVTRPEEIPAADTPQPPATVPVAVVEAVRTAAAATPTVDVTNSIFMPARHAAFWRRFYLP